jgi:hypothetical protein
MSFLSEGTGSVNVLVEYLAVALYISHFWSFVPYMDEGSTSKLFNAVHCVGDCRFPYRLSHVAITFWGNYI